MKTNRKAAQAKRPRNGREIAPPVGTNAPDAENAKAAFLEAFGHGADYHARFDPAAGAEPEAVGAFTFGRFAASGLTGDIGCGWWFCSAEADSVNWLEMEKALACLLRAGIDPHGRDVARLGSEYSRVSGWASERDAYQVLRESLRSLRGKLPSTSDAERLRKNWLAELAPLHRNAFDAKPLDSGRANLARQAVIAAAKPAGWKPQHVAAALALTGAEKLTADRDFKDIKGDMRKAFPRVSRR
jgi:hypothetical protein